MTKTGRNILLPLAAAILLYAGPSSAAQADSSPSRAVLVRGTLSVRSLPHLPINSIAALYGEYLWNGSTVRAWVVRDELYLSGDWTEFQVRLSSVATLRGFSKKVGSGDQGLVFAGRDASYWILLEFPRTDGDPRGFIGAFFTRLAYFASQSKSYSDLSLPAVLEIR